MSKYHAYRIRPDMTEAEMEELYWSNHAPDREERMRRSLLEEAIAEAQVIAEQKAAT